MSTSPNAASAIRTFRSLPALAGLLAVLGGALAMGWLGSRLPGQKGEVVFVRTSEVMARYKGAIQSREVFKKETSAWEGEAQELQGKLKEKLKGLKPQDTKGIEEVRELRSRLQALQEKGAQRDQELMAPVVAEVNAGIKRFAQKHGYRIVLGTGNGGVILHGDDLVDVTEVLLAELNR